MWWLLAAGDIRQRYQRSMLGQFWLTISMGVTVGAIGLIYSRAVSQGYDDVLALPRRRARCWSLIAGIFIDGCTVFTQSADFMRQSQLPRSLFVNRMLLRNLIVFAHNLVIVLLIVAFSRYRSVGSCSWSFQDSALMMSAGTWAGLFLGALCARFGDPRRSSQA